MSHPFTVIQSVWLATMTLLSLLRPLLAVFREGNKRNSFPAARSSEPTRRSIGLALFAASIFSAPATAATVDAVEYYHAGFGHYFMTGDAAEEAAIDAGKVSGWVRTGQTFKAHSTQEAGDSTVCRFFSTTFAPKSSHFYTPAVAECDLVKTNPNWLYEGTAFYIQTPSASGVCPAGAQMVYRLYNNGNGGAPNHRYTASMTIRNQMIAAGWIPEGVGDGVSFCAGDAASASDEEFRESSAASNDDVNFVPWADVQSSDEASGASRVKVSAPNVRLPVASFRQVPPCKTAKLDTTKNSTGNCGLASALMAIQYSKGIAYDSADRPSENDFATAIVEAQASLYNSQGGLDYKKQYDGTWGNLASDSQHCGVGTSESTLVTLANQSGIPAAKGTLDSKRTAAEIADDIRSVLQNKGLYIALVTAQTDSYLGPYPATTVRTMQKTSGGHWVTIVGIDDKNIYINDPIAIDQTPGQPYGYTIDSFIDTWKKKGGSYAIVGNALGGIYVPKSIDMVRGKPATMTFRTVTGASAKWSGSGLPTGLALSADGTLSGTPQKAGEQIITITAVKPDNSTQAVTTNVTVTIAESGTIPPSFTSPQSLTPIAMVGQLYRYIFDVSGGSVQISLDSGALPSGLSLNGSVLAGTPLVAGTYGFRLTATDTASEMSASKDFQLVVSHAVSAVVGPRISYISPATFMGANTAQQIVINGSNFSAQSSVMLRNKSSGASYSNPGVNFLSPQQISAQLVFGQAASAWSAEVINPDGSTSGEFAFQVSAPSATLVPTITDVNPSPVMGSPIAQNLTIYGSNFVSGATVVLNDIGHGGTYNKASSFNHSGQLSISAKFTTTASTWSAQVVNPDGQTSGTFTFKVQAPAAATAPDLQVLSGLVSPGSVRSGGAVSASWTISNQGSGSANASTTAVRINQSSGNASGGNLAVLGVSSLGAGTSQSQSTSLTAPTTVGTYYVWVLADNYSTAGQSASAAANDIVLIGSFTVAANASAPSPVISSLSPNPVTGSASLQTLTVYGSNFVNGATVVLTDIGHGGTYTKASSFSNSGQLSISANFTTTASTWSAQVVNPDGKSSGTFTFTVQAAAVPPPSISAVSPNPVTGSASSQTLTVYGSNFVSGATVVLTDIGHGGTYTKASSFSNSGQLSISANFTTTASTWSARVVNPDGQSSATLNFTVR